MMHRPNYSYGSSKEDIRKQIEEAEMKRLGKNKSGGTGFKMSDDKRKKNRKNRK